MKDTFKGLNDALPPSVTFEELRRFAPVFLWESQPDLALRLALEKCGLFDGERYLNENPDLKFAQVDPVRHYVDHGINEMRPFPLVEAKADPACAHGAKVSLLVPVYNNSMFLRECFESLIRQTMREIEILILDDGSTEKAALEIMREYAALDPRVALINKANGGYGQTLNMGLELARGKYIGIVESDDYIAPEMCERLYEKCEANNLDYIKTGFIRFFGGPGNRLFERVSLLPDSASRYGKVFNSWTDEGCHSKLSVIWNGLYRLDFLKKNRIRFNESPGASFQDNGFWFLTFAHGRRFMIVDEKYYYLRRDNPESSVFDAGRVERIVGEFRYLEQELRKRPGFLERFGEIFNLKKYWAYLFALERVEKNSRPEFARFMASELAAAQSRGKLNPDLFGAEHEQALGIISGDLSCVKFREPDVSIIMPVYNSEKFIEACISSLQQQTFENFELICVDDGSTDRTYPIIRKLSWEDRRIRVFRQENRGASVARNSGYCHALGDFVMFLDSDDEFHPDMLQSMLERISKTGSDFCICRSAELKDDGGVEPEIWYSVLKQEIPDPDNFNVESIGGNIFFSVMGWAWDKLYRREFLDSHRIRFQEISSSNDLLFTFKTLLLADRISLCDKILVRHRQNNPGSISNTRSKNPLAFLEAIYGLKDFLVERGLYGKYAASLADYAVHFFNWHLETLTGEAAIAILAQKQRFAAEFNLDKIEAKRFLHPDGLAKFRAV